MEFCETAIKFNAISKTSLCQKRSKILGRCHLLWLLLSTWALVSYENHWTCPFLMYWKEDGKECLTLEIMLLALQSCFIDFNVIQGRFKRIEIYPFYRNAISPAKHNLLFSTPSVKKSSIDNSLQIPLAYFLPTADVFADLLDTYIIAQQKIKKIKRQPHLRSANQCLNEQFL